MRREALQVLACPECALPLPEVASASEPLAMGTLRCGQGHEFEITDGISRLVRNSDRLRIQSFADSYANAWARDGWGCTDLAYFENLPQRDVTRRHVAEWRVKARSMAALFSVLDPQKWPRVVDLGCGNGWLSHHLAARGHDVYAVDVVLDDRVGLAAAEAYVRLGPPFRRIWADMARLPFQSSSIDAVVCNASLHYARDLRGALREIVRVLRVGGVLAILNSPVYAQPASAARALSDFRAHLRELGSSDEVASTYKNFIRSDLESEVRTSAGFVYEVRFDPGVWFRWWRRLKGIALGMELASFPVLIAVKREDGAPDKT